MSVDEARRLALHEAAAHNRWNAEAALTLMEMLPPSGWGDVATRQHVDARLDALEHRIDLRFQLVDQRLGAIDQRLSDQITAVTTQLEKQITGVEARLDARIDARVEGALNRSIRWNVGTMIALAGVATAVARLG